MRVIGRKRQCFGRLLERFLGHIVLDLAGHLSIGGTAWVVYFQVVWVWVWVWIYAEDRFTPLRDTQRAGRLWVAEQDTHSWLQAKGLPYLLFDVLRFWIAKDTQYSLTFPFPLLS